MRYFTPWGRPGHTEQRKAAVLNGSIYFWFSIDYLPRFIQTIAGRTKTIIGDAVISTQDTGKPKVFIFRVW